MAAHDGFTLADLTSYDPKHNEANGEDNRDGSNGNTSWNHGVEGPTDDEAVEAARARTLRNLLGTLLLSTGVPMLNAGDEMGRTQGGNNNAYCQDNETSWLDWDLAPWQRDLLATTRHLTRVRRDLPALRQRVWALGRQVHDDGSRDMEWYAADGTAMGGGWDDGTRVVQMYVAGAWMGAELRARRRQRQRPRAGGDARPRRPASRRTGCSGTATTSAPGPPGHRSHPGR